MNILKTFLQYSRLKYLLPAISLFSCTHLSLNAATVEAPAPDNLARLNAQTTLPCFSGQWASLKSLVYMSYPRTEENNEQIIRSLEAVTFPEVISISGEALDLSSVVDFGGFHATLVAPYSRLTQNLFTNLFRIVRTEQENRGERHISGATPRTLLAALHTYVCPLVGSDYLQPGLTSLCTKSSSVVSLLDGRYYAIPGSIKALSNTTFNDIAARETLKAALLLVRYCIATAALDILPTDALLAPLDAMLSSGVNNDYSDKGPYTAKEGYRAPLYPDPDYRARVTTSLAGGDKADFGVVIEGQEGHFRFPSKLPFFGPAEGGDYARMLFNRCLFWLPEAAGRGRPKYSLTVDGATSA